MTEPTDVGPSTADQLFRLIRSFGYTTHRQTAEIVDAIVAKWGTPLPVAHIRDVDFMKTHFVVIDSQGFQVAWREEAVLPFVGRPELPGYDAWQEETALFLKYEEDGLLFEAYLTVEGLSALTWSTEKEAFVGPDGSVYTFYTEEKCRPYVPRS